MDSKLTHAIVATALVFTLHGASAGTWHYLEAPALTGEWPGPDGLWGTGDGATFPSPGEGTLGPLPISGLTPSNFFTFGGGATSSTDSSGVFGTTVGTWVTNGGAPDHPGVNTYTSLTTTGLFHNDFFPFVDFPVSGSLSATGTSEIIVSPDGRTFTSTLSVDFPAGGLRGDFVGSGFSLFAGEDPNVVFAGDPAIAGHFALLVPLAPVGWEVLATQIYTFENFDIITGDPLGVTGSGVSVGYTFDAPVPIPPAVLLLGSAFAALVGVNRRRVFGVRIG